MEKRPGLLPDARERLKLLVDQHGGPTAVAFATNLPKSTLDKYVGGFSEPPAIRLAQIAQHCRSSVEWIISGSDPSSHLVMSQRQVGWFPKMEALAMIPRLNVRASAGIGVANQDDAEPERVPFSTAMLRRLGVAAEKAHFIQADGDSMADTIFDKDDVLVDTGARDLRSEGIYAVVLGDLAMIKRVQAALGSYTLLSDNERYAPIQVAASEVDQLRVIGRAKLVMRVL